MFSVGKADFSFVVFAPVERRHTKSVKLTFISKSGIHTLNKCWGVKYSFFKIFLFYECFGVSFSLITLVYKDNEKIEWP